MALARQSIFPGLLFAHKVECLLLAVEPALKLFGLDAGKELFELWAGRHTEPDQVFAGDQWLRDEWLGSELLLLFPEEFKVVGEAVAAGAVNPV